jgi:phospholipase C
MSHPSRRRFLQGASAAALAAGLPASIERALALPGNHRTGTIADVEHIVILTQENRAFDHIFGTLRGVRGFDDPRAVKLPNGNSVLKQPAAANPDGFLLPFHPGDLGSVNPGLQFLNDVPHGWTDSHGAFADGRYDSWVKFKGTNALTLLTREDIPFHYALADAFTICDAYYCSVLGPTDPNRYHLWTGFTGNTGSGKFVPPRSTAPDGPVVDNSEEGYDWTTYPERLTAAGVSWKIYQDEGRGSRPRAFRGLHRQRLHRQFRRQLAALFLPVPERATRFGAVRARAPRHPHLAGRHAPRHQRHAAALHPARRRRPRQQPAAGVVDSGARRLLRASQLADRFRRLVRLAGAQRLDQQRGKLEQDRVPAQLRRKRRLLRPSRAALSAG